MYEFVCLTFILNYEKCVTHAKATRNKDTARYVYAGPLHFFQHLLYCLISSLYNRNRVVLVLNVKRDEIQSEATGDDKTQNRGHFLRLFTLSNTFCCHKNS